MLDQIKHSLQDAVKMIDSSIELSIDDIEVSLLFDEKGDFTTNVALKLSKLLKQKPLDLAKSIIENTSSITARGATVNLLKPTRQGWSNDCLYKTLSNNARCTT